MKSSPHLMAASNCTHADAFRHAEMAVWDEVVATLDVDPWPWRSPEEGAMVLADEIDELWEQVKANRTGRARAIAAHIGSTATRFAAQAGPGCEQVPGDGQLSRQQCKVTVADRRNVQSSVGPTRALASGHEAFGFLKREYDGMWTAIRTGASARTSALRVAAMAVRFIAEITPATTPVSVTR